MATLTGFIFSAPTTNSISTPVAESISGVGGSWGALGLIYGWDNDLQSHEPIPIPDHGTAYSYSKAIGLVVLDATDTNITNRQISMALPPAGLHVYWESRATFPSQTGPVAETTGGVDVAPGDFTGEILGGPQVYDGQPAPAALGRNGNYIRVALSASSLWKTIPDENGTLVALPPIILSWDETA